MRYFDRLKNKIKKEIFKTIFPRNFFYFSRSGYCPCCEKNVVFRSHSDWLRDFFQCSNCGSIPRERALMLVIEKYYPNWKDLKIHESSPVDRGASFKLKKYSKNYITSQFFPDKVYGGSYNIVLNENLEEQTFKDGTFDLVITQDVMEHIYNPAKAFSEIARTLIKGGAHIFTVPLVNKHKSTEVLAKKKENGNTEFLKTPEYHANPIDPKGSTVTMHWGYDIVDFIFNSSGMETIIEYTDNIDYGIRAEYNEVLVSRKV